MSKKNKSKNYKEFSDEEIMDYYIKMSKILFENKEKLLEPTQIEYNDDNELKEINIDKEQNKKVMQLFEDMTDGENLQEIFEEVDRRVRAEDVKEGEKSLLKKFKGKIHEELENDERMVLFALRAG